MSSLKEKVNWINKYILDSMNTTDRDDILQLRQEVEKYSKRLYLENLCVQDNSQSPKGKADDRVG